MKRTLQRTIYLVIFLLYIFALYASPLGVLQDYSEEFAENNLSEVRYDSRFNIGKLDEVLGITQTFSFKPELGSIHQYDDSKHNQESFEFEESGKGVASSLPAAYSRHENTSNDREVLGFLPYWELNEYEDIDYAKFSTIAYFALTSDSGGSWVSSDPGYAGFHSTAFTNMVTKAHAKNVKVILVAKNFDPFSIRQIINNVDGAGNRLINRIVTAIRDKSLDGVNVDFEYVSSNVTNELRATFANWHHQLADRIHSEFPNAHVSTDVFGSSGNPGTIYDMAALGDTPLDYILMMTYDYITTSCYAGKRITPMSPLYGNDGWNTSTHLTLGANQAGSQKILMGIPYYGIDFQVKGADSNEYNARVDYPDCNGAIETYASIVDPKEDAYHNPASLRWNGSEKARWYRYQYEGEWRHGYYDDPLSLSAKYDFVRSKNLGGIGIWVIGYDNNAKELYDVIREKFQIVPFYVAFQYGLSDVRINQILSSNGVEIEGSLGSYTYLVKPLSQVSSNIMKNLRVYDEVVNVTFEVDGFSRGIN